MFKKKLAVSITSVVIAMATFFAVGEASAATHKVSAGETLWRISHNNNVSVADLKKWNNLRNNIIYPNQVLKLKKTAVTKAKPKAKKVTTKKKTTKTKAVSKSTTSPVTGVINSAQSVIGTKYKWGGTTRSGFDCSGFIHWAYNNAGKTMARATTTGYFNRSYKISKSQLKEGDLVFFAGTYRSGISHMGIYAGNNKFIHASSSKGVTVTSLNNSYWSKHFHSFKRFY